jgi:TonB family protein
MLKKMGPFQYLNLRTFIFTSAFVLVIALNQFVASAQGLNSPNALPVYPGGNKALKEFLDKNLHYPLEAKNAGISGTVQVTFLVDNEGRVQNIKVKHGISLECDAEAIRVTALLTGWTPGIRQGKKVGILVSMPVEFQSGKKIQPIIVTGLVTEKSKDTTVEGAFVIIKGTNTGTITNKDGWYRLEVPGEKQYLEFRSTGYSTKVEPIENHSTINVELDTEYLIIDFDVTEN